MLNPGVIDRVATVLQANDNVQVFFDPPADGPRDGEYANRNDSSLHPSLSNLLDQEAPNGLYGHQHETIESVLSGHHTIAATRTSSGKSLTFSLPALDALCRDPNATALFLYPQKALANDQLIKLQKSLEAVPELASRLRDRPHFVSRYDGSTEQESRKDIRSQVQLMITNPDMLHLAILQHHRTPEWARFFKNLKVIAIDECHEYRGIFGTNVAYILRRLRQICQLHGSNPTFVATSATIADPQAHMKELVGTDFALIDSSRDSSKQGRRKFWMLRGEGHHYDFSRNLAQALVEQGLRVLAFCPSRVAAEKMLSRMRNPAGELAEHVAVYRSGLKSEERETIERQLRDGTKRLVFSTSALELGIDIGGLDVVICVGLPSSMMSLWQRAGRVARAGREGAIILIPGNTPLDAYYTRHPDELFERRNETLALNLGNVRVACQHYACAVAENPAGESELAIDILGETTGIIRQLRQSGKINRPEFYLTEPHGDISIRNTGETNYCLMCDQEKIGEIGSFHLLREAPRNALYRHNGRVYRVQDVIRGRKVVRLRPEFTRNETISMVRKSIRQRQVLKIDEYEHISVSVARIDVNEYLQSVSEKDPSGNQVRTMEVTGMPNHHLPTEGVAIKLNTALVARLQSQMQTRVDIALASVERLMVNLFPIIAGPCDSQDFSSGIERSNDGSLTLYLYDNVYDGVNLTSIAHERLDQLLFKVEERISACDCTDDSGCVQCIADPQRNAQSSKTDATAIVRTLLEMISTQTPRRTVFEQPNEGFESIPTEVECPSCSALVSHKSKFCPECGHRMEVQQHVDV